MTYTPTKTLTFEAFIAQYGDDPRYELIDGELRSLEPTGPHESVAGKVAGYIYAEILRQQFAWTVPKNCLIKPPATAATALRPDVIVLDEAVLESEPLWQREPIITSGETIQLVVEVVSTNWQDDYARKVEEYALLQVPEYWIVDFAGLGGTAFIGKPKQPTFTVCQLRGEEYDRTLYRLGDVISSQILPELNLRLDNVA
ncbi:MAG: Uma2 family endonuclease [Cyanobacteria bacterium J06628_6]